MSTAVINFYAGPGAGKSTSSAFVYSALKNKGFNAELVREYVKDWAYEDRKVGVYDQMYLLGKQVRKESMLLDKVQVIVTDSPVYLCAYYAERYSPPLIRNGVESCVQGYYQQAKADGHEHFHIWLNRSKPYLQAGRWQDEGQARDIDTQLKPFLQKRGINLIETSSDFDSLGAMLKGIGF